MIQTYKVKTPSPLFYLQSIHFHLMGGVTTEDKTVSRIPCNTKFCAKIYALAHNAMRGQKERDKTKIKTHFKTKVKTELKRFSEYRLVKTDLKQS